MSVDKDALKESGEQVLGSGFKREAPPQKELTRSKQEEEWIRWGKPARYRIRPVTIDTVKAQADKHHVQIGSFVDFLLTSALIALENGRLEVPAPVDDEAKRRKLSLPPVPERFR